MNMQAESFPLKDGHPQNSSQCVDGRADKEARGAGTPVLPRHAVASAACPPSRAKQRFPPWSQSAPQLSRPQAPRLLMLLRCFSRCGREGGWCAGGAGARGLGQPARGFSVWGSAHQSVPEAPRPVAGPHVHRPCSTVLASRNPQGPDGQASSPKRSAVVPDPAAAETASGRCPHSVSEQPVCPEEKHTGILDSLRPGPSEQHGWLSPLLPPCVLSAPRARTSSQVTLTFPWPPRGMARL